MTSLPGGFTPTYDANGNILNDSFHTYTWDVNGRPLTIDSVSMTYDAAGRMVEQNRSGVYTQIVYAPTGAKLALMNGQTLQKAFVPLTGGATAVYTASGLSYYRHSDWLGSSRLASTPTRTVYSATAYAPFGEPYAQSGTADLSFTGQNQDTAGGSYDFLAREYAILGRWPSPDPMGGDIGNPQSLNRYAYVMNNPLALFDPLGLDPTGDPCAGHTAPGGCVSVTEDAPSFEPHFVDVPGICTTVMINGIAPSSNGCSPYPPGVHGGREGDGNTSGGTSKTAISPKNKCLNQIYNTPEGKAVQFFSPLSLLPAWNPNAMTNLKEWAVAAAGKGGGLLLAGHEMANGSSAFITTLNGTQSVASTWETVVNGLSDVGLEVAPYAMGGAMLADLLAHASCSLDPNAPPEGIVVGPK